MKIAILGWGSLIWNPDGLPHDGRWRMGGPTLPIEFSRISPDGRLTLVVDPDHGPAVVTRWSLSPRDSIEPAVVDLATRERCRPDGIGYLDLGSGAHSRERFPRQKDVDRIVRGWGDREGVEAVLWTALPATFEARTGSPFSVQRGLDYLAGLSGPLRETALDYVRNAPREVDTPLRRAFASDPRFTSRG